MASGFPNTGLLSVLMNLLEEESLDSTSSGSSSTLFSNIKDVFHAFNQTHKPFLDPEIFGKLQPLFDEAKKSFNGENPDYFQLLESVTTSLFDSFRDPSLSIWANSLPEQLPRLQTRICTALLFYSFFYQSTSETTSESETTSKVDDTPVSPPSAIENTVNDTDDCIDNPTDEQPAPIPSSSSDAHSVESNIQSWDIPKFETIDEFIKFIKVKSDDHRSVCTTIWKNAVFYRCFTCSTSRSSTICVDCFHSGDHSGHDYYLCHSTVGGTCDCGATNGILQRGFCSHHKGTDSEDDPSLFLPPTFRKSVYTVTSIVISRLQALVSSIVSRTLHNSTGYSEHDFRFIKHNPSDESSPFSYFRYGSSAPISRVDCDIVSALYSSKFASAIPLCLAFFPAEDLLVFEVLSKWLTQLSSLSQAFRRIITNAILDAEPIDPKKTISQMKDYQKNGVPSDSTPETPETPQTETLETPQTETETPHHAVPLELSNCDNESLPTTQEQTPLSSTPSTPKQKSKTLDFTKVSQDILFHGPVAEPRTFLSVFFFEIGPYLPNTSTVIDLLMTLIFDHKFKASSSPGFLKNVSFWGRDLAVLSSDVHSQSSISTPWLTEKERQTRLDSWNAMFKIVSVQYFADPIFVRTAVEYGNAVEIMLRLVSVLTNYVSEREIPISGRKEQSLEALSKRHSLLEERESLINQQPPLSALLLSYLGLGSLSTWVYTQSKKLVEINSQFSDFDFLTVGPTGHSNFSSEPRLSIVSDVVSMDHRLVQNALIRSFLNHFIHLFQVTEFIRTLWKLSPLQWANHEIPGPATARLEKSFQSFIQHSTASQLINKDELPAHSYDYASIPSIESIEALEFWNPTPDSRINNFSMSWPIINRSIVSQLLIRFHGMDMHKTGAVTWSEVQRRDRVTRAFSFTWNLARISWSICNCLLSEPSFSTTRAVPAHNFLLDTNLPIGLADTCNSIIDYLYAFLTTKRIPPFRSLRNELEYSTCDLPILLDRLGRVRYDISFQPMTFHIPIHRYLGHFLATYRIFTTLDPSSSSNISLSPVVARTIMEHPLRIFAGLAHLGTTKAGTELRRRLQNYHGNGNSHTTILTDLFILAECISVIEKAEDGAFIDSSSIWSAFFSKFGSDIFQYSFPLDDDLAAETIYKTHRLLALVIALGSFDYSSSILLPNHPILSRKDVIQAVSFGVTHRSLLESCLLRTCIHGTDIDTLVHSSDTCFVDSEPISEWHEPDIKTPGYYTLKDAAWDEFDPYFFRGDPVWSDISVQNWYRQVWYIMAAGDEKIPIFPFNSYFNKVKLNPNFCHPLCLASLTFAPKTEILSSKWYWGVAGSLLARHRHDRMTKHGARSSSSSSRSEISRTGSPPEGPISPELSDDDDDENIHHEGALSVIWLDLLFSLSTGLIHFQRVSLDENEPSIDTVETEIPNSLPHVSVGFKSEFHQLFPDPREKPGHPGSSVSPLVKPFWKSYIPIYASRTDDPNNFYPVPKQKCIPQASPVFGGSTDKIHSLITPLNSLFDPIPLISSVGSAIISGSNSLTPSIPISIFTLLVDALLDPEVDMPSRIPVPTSFDKKKGVCENQSGNGILLLERALLENVVAAICIIDSSRGNKANGATEYVTTVLSSKKRLCKIPNSLSDLTHIKPYSIFTKKTRPVPLIRISHSERHDSVLGKSSSASVARSPSPRTKRRAFEDTAKNLQQQAMEEITSLSSKFLEQLMAEEDSEEEEEDVALSTIEGEGIQASTVLPLLENIVDGFWGTSGGTDSLYALTKDNECQQCKNENSDSIGVISSIETHRIVAQTRNYHITKQVSDLQSLSRRRLHSLKVSDSEEMDYWALKSVQAEAKQQQTDVYTSVMMDPHGSSILGFQPASVSAIEQSKKSNTSLEQEENSTTEVEVEPIVLEPVPKEPLPSSVVLMFLNDIDASIFCNHRFSCITSKDRVTLGSEHEKHISLCGHIDSSNGEPRIHVLHHSCHIQMTKHLVQKRRQIENRDPATLNTITFNAYAGEYPCPNCRSNNSTLVPLPQAPSLKKSKSVRSRSISFSKSKIKTKSLSPTPLFDVIDLDEEPINLAELLVNTGQQSKFWTNLETFYSKYYSDTLSHHSLSDLTISASLYNVGAVDSDSVAPFVKNLGQSDDYWGHLWDWSWMTFCRLNIPIFPVGIDSATVNKSRTLKKFIDLTPELAVRVFPYLFSLLYQELRTSEYVKRSRPNTPFDGVNGSSIPDDGKIPGYTNGLEATRLLILWASVYHFFCKLTGSFYRRRWSVLYSTLLRGYTVVQNRANSDASGSSTANGTIPVYFDKDESPSGSSSSSSHSKGLGSFFGGIPSILGYDSIQVFLGLLLSGIPTWNKEEKKWTISAPLSDPFTFGSLANACLGVAWIQALYSIAYNPSVYLYLLNGEKLSLQAKHILDPTVVETCNPLDVAKWDPQLLRTVKWIVSPNFTIMYRILYSGILNFEADADFSQPPSIPHKIVKSWIFSANLSSPTFDPKSMNMVTKGTFKPLLNTKSPTPNIPSSVFSVIVPPLPPLLGIRRDIPDPWINLIDGKISQELKYYHFYPSYLAFMEANRNRKCSNCGTQPNRPAVCLSCGKFVCMLSTCCSVGSVREMTHHAKTCGTGYCIFLDLAQCLILVMNDNLALYPHRSFVDKYGEEDPGLYRGKPLYLHSKNFYTLNRLYYGLLFHHDPLSVKDCFVHARP